MNCKQLFYPVKQNNNKFFFHDKIIFENAVNENTTLRGFVTK